MITRYLPKIASEHHDTFRRIVEAYPADTYNNWLYLQAKEIAEVRGKDCKVVLVEVSPDEFTRFCDRIRAKRNFHTLRGLAFEKGTGKQY